MGSTDGKVGYNELWFDKGGASIPDSEATAGNGRWTVSFEGGPAQRRSPVTETSNTVIEPTTGDVRTQRLAKDLDAAVTRLKQSLELLKSKTPDISKTNDGSKPNLQSRDQIVVGRPPSAGIAEQARSGSNNTANPNEPTSDVRKGSSPALAASDNETSKAVGLAGTSTPTPTAPSTSPSRVTAAAAKADPLVRARLIGRLEASIGVDATTEYIKIVDANAGGDGQIDNLEAPEFGKRVITTILLTRMHWYDTNFPNGGTRPTPSWLPQRSVKQRPDFEREWREILCEGSTPLENVKHEAKTLGFKISDESANIAALAGCNR